MVIENRTKIHPRPIHMLLGFGLLVISQIGCLQPIVHKDFDAPPAQLPSQLINQQMMPANHSGYDPTVVKPAGYYTPVQEDVPVTQAGYQQHPQGSTAAQHSEAAQPRKDVFRFQSPQKKDVGKLFDPSTGRKLQGDASSKQSQIVRKVVILGNRRVPTAQIIRNLKTKVGRYLDPDLLQQDVQAIWRMETIRRVVGPYLKEVSDGIVVTFEVKEHPVIQSLRFVGNRVMTDNALRREIGLEVGKPLNEFEVRLARDKLQEMYKTKGYTHSHVELLETKDPSNVVFRIFEDTPQKISKVSFEGNTVAPDGRLRSIIGSKAQILWLFGGNLDREKVNRDTEKLTAYYFSLGYFNAKIGREIIKDPGSGKVELRFVINEGVRYRVRSVKFIGPQKFDSGSLRELVKLKPSNSEMPYFEKAQMDKDVNTLRDSYGANGYIFAKIQAQPRFLEEPGLMDLVYQVQEGEAYRVGKINIHIEGDGITRRSVIWNRLIQKPGEMIDIRKIRQSERLLLSSKLFTDPADPSSRPKITIKPAGGEATAIR